jgi:superfamily II RNA helicase
MVKICSVTNYPDDNEAKYKEYFEKFNYPLHIFQKWAIEGIVEGQDVLCCCPTASGKSLPAEFALDYFHSKGKKTIYTCPVKSLSNQKFNDFTQKYPHINIGVVTGDLVCNPNADVIVMTTEILLNKLYQLKSKSPKVNSSTSFEMDIEKELGCVVFDEIHFIGDSARGMVWENSIMLLPKHIQIVGLSATLDNPEKFAQWIENRGEEKSDKVVYLTSKKDRAVPLIHYSFITATQGIFKAIKDKSVHQEIRSIIDKPFVIQDHNGKFDELHYLKMTKMLKLFEIKEIRIKRTHVLNQVTKYLTENVMTPAICYIFSIKKIEECSKEITTNLLEFDSKVPYIVKRECEQILRNKLSNYQEYLHLPEYITLVSLLEKGIATHHSKMLPVLREIVEILFAKGYIKLLFATETVAIGLNLAVKSCIFTDINKHDGTSMRMLQGHEYTQSAGRSGRLGLDKVGHSIHLNNLFRNVELTSYKTMLNGKPQTLTSKFKISYNLLLNLIDTNTDNINFANKSMIKGDIDRQSEEIQKNIEKMETEYKKMEETIKHLKTPIETVKEYIDCIERRPNTVNKKRKDIDRQIQTILDNYKSIESDKIIIQKYLLKQPELENMKKEYENVTKYIDNNNLIITDMLEKDDFISNSTVSNSTVSNSTVSNALESVETKYVLTQKGILATQLRETHCLVFANLFDSKVLDDLTSRQLVSIFSCFTNISVQDELKALFPKSDNKTVQNMVIKIKEMYDEYQQKEIMNQINTGTDYSIHFDLLDYVIQWCDCDSIEECKFLLQTLEKEKGIFLGEFVKALLKINNISSELEKVSELSSNIQFLSKLKEIPTMILKYVVTNQSLYV